MKKICLLWIVILTFTLLGCTPKTEENMSIDYKNYDITNFEKNFQETLKTADHINKNSNLGLELFQLLDDKASNWTTDTPFVYYTDDKDVVGEGIPYPRNSNDVRLVILTINSSSYDFLGIKIGDKRNKIYEIMENNNFDLFYDGENIPYRKNESIITYRN